MCTTIDGYKEIKDIYEKLSELRETARSYTQKMTDTFSADQWLEKDLMDSLTAATERLANVQTSLFDELQKHGIPVQDTLTHTQEAVENWHKEELDKRMIVELKKVLNDVCAIVYDGKIEEIKLDLAKIQKEASELTKDLKHFAEHGERIQDFSSLVKWVKSEKDLSLKDTQYCLNKFGINILYALNHNALKIAEHSDILDNSEIVSGITPKPEEETTANDSINDTLPECSFFEDSLPIDCRPVKPQMYKSPRKFKNEFEKWLPGCENSGYSLLRLLILNLMITPSLYKALQFKNDKKAEGVFDRVLSSVYELGLVQKLTLLGEESYILNRDIGDLVSIYKSETLKKLLKLSSLASSVLEMPTTIPAIWHIRFFIKGKLFEKLQREDKEYSLSSNQEQCTAIMSEQDVQTKAKHVIGIVVSVFNHDNEQTDRKQITDFISEQLSEMEALVVAIRGTEEITYWNDKLSSFNLPKLAYYNYVKNILIDKDGTEEITAEAFWATPEKCKVLNNEQESKEPQNVSEPHNVEEDNEEGNSAPPLIKDSPKKSAEVVIEPKASDFIEEPSTSISAKVTSKNEPVKVELPAKLSTPKEETANEEPAVEVEAPKEPVSTPIHTETDATEITTKIESPKSTISEEQIPEIIKTVSEQFDKHHVAEGMLMLHGMHHLIREDWSLQLLGQISYVLGDPLYSHIPVKEAPYKYWNNTVDVPKVDLGNSMDYFNAASMVRYFFKPSYNNGGWHWQANQVWNQINNDSSNVALQSFPEIKNVINCFRTFLVKNERGIGWCLGGQNKVQEEQQQDLHVCENELRNMKQRLENRKGKQSCFRRITATYNEICRNSELYFYVSSPQEWSTDELLHFCNTFSDTPISKEDILNDDSVNYAVSGPKLDQYMDDVWGSIQVAYKQTERFSGSIRTSLKKLLADAFSALGNYVIARYRVECKDGTVVDGKVVKKTIDEARQFCTDLIGKLQEYHTSNTMENMAVFSLKYLIKTLLKTFSAGYLPMEFYEPFLLTDYVELDTRYLPCVDFDFQISDLSLYNRCLKHIDVIEKEALYPCDTDTYKELAETAREKMNMGFYKLLLRRLNRDLDIKEDDITQRGGEYLQRAQDDFRSDLELDYNYGKLTQKKEIESYEDMSKALVNHLQETQNFGLFRVFVDACKSRIDIDSEPRRNDLEKQFVALKDFLYKRIYSTQESFDDYPILHEIEKCLASKNFSVAEDYMRQCQDGNLTEIKSLLGGNPEEFMRFVDSYQTYYNICSKNGSRNLDHTLDQWFSNKGKSRSAAMKNTVGKGQINFVKEWDRLLVFGRGTPQTPENFLEMLGYPKPGKVTRDKDQPTNRRVYDLTFTSEPTHQYAHPFKQFGSGIYERGLRMVTFTGAHSPENIVNELSGAGVERQTGTICLLDSSMPWSDRCKLAELMKCSDTMYNVIVIDRVMALYLSRFEKLQRQNIMMKLCMPFANATPFSSKGFIAPEMFIGRTKELADIRNMDGPNLVYGGRQLGKSILLRQVSFLDNQPSKGYYAFYFDMKGKDSENVLSDISKQLVNAKLLNHKIDDWDSLDNAMEEIASKVTQLILLIDEADAFILSSNEEKDHPIEVLRMTQNKYTGKFKFVLAGLHNVIRYDKKSLSSNTVYGQLEHINIRPFEFADACDLLLKPLSYLGFTISDPAIVSTILAKTNYFPGLIQYYGMKILESVKSAYRKHNFKNTNTPPYKLDETYLKNLMEDDSFLREIEDKFMITLRVDKEDDNLYYLITLGIAYLYAAEDKPVTLEKIRDVLSGTKVRDLDDSKLLALLDELKELNVLRIVNENEYIFNRYSFYSMLGGAEKIEKALSEYEDR